MSRRVASREADAALSLTLIVGVALIGVVLLFGWALS